MAQTNINKRLAEINKREKLARDKFRKENGYKIAQGFKETDVYKSLEQDRADVARLAENLRKYDRTEREARERYKLETGKKTSVGFGKTKEGKRIAARRRQLEYRANRRGMEREVNRRELMANPLKPGNNFNRRQHKENLKTNIQAAGFEPPLVLAAGEIYHHVLGYSDRLPRAIRDAFRKIKSYARKVGRAVWVVVTYPQGGVGKYNTNLGVDRAFAALYQMGLARQAQTGSSDALYIDAVQTDGVQGYYFFVDGYYK